jgi:hypothetical protein
MKRTFRLLLRLYPLDHRQLLGNEMLQVFEQAAEEHRAHGRLAFLFFAFFEFAGLLFGSISAWRRYRRSDRAIDLRKMRPPEVSKATYVTAVDEMIAAQQLVAVNLSRLQDAIARQELVKARFYSDEEHKAREHLRAVHRKYRIAE